MTVYVLYVTAVQMSALTNSQSRLLIEIFTTLPVKKLSNGAFRQLCEARIKELYDAGQLEHQLWVPHEVYTSRPHSFTAD